MAGDVKNISNNETENAVETLKKTKNRDPIRNPSIELYFTTIIKTTNLSDEIAEKLVTNLSVEIFTPRKGVMSGFSENFIVENNDCQMGYIGFDNEWWSGKENDSKDTNQFDVNNEKHAKMYKLSYAKETGGKYDRFSDIFIIPKLDLILINSPENQNINNKLFNAIKTIKSNIKYKNFSHDVVTIEPKFLLWLCYKKDKNHDKISENISLYNYNIIKVGDSNNYVNTSTNDIMTKSKSQQQELSLPTIYGIINDKNIDYLKGRFKFKTAKFPVSFKIKYSKKETDNYLRVFSENLIGKTNYCGKLKMCIPFISEFINIISSWENLDEDKKLPPSDFIKKLKKNYDKEQKITNKKYDEFIELYKVKAGEFDVNYLKSRANLP